MNVETYVANDSLGAPCTYCHVRKKEIVIGVRYCSITAICVPCLKQHISSITICYMAYDNFKELMARLTSE